MCFHDKPLRNDEMKGFLNPQGVAWEAPATQEKDVILFDECGRCRPQVNGSGNGDYHSHHFRIVQEGDAGQVLLLVRHGGGEERISLGYKHTRIAEILGILDSDARYLMIYALYSASRDATREASEKERIRWCNAAAAKQIRTRKSQGRVQVWIDDSSPRKE